MPELVRIGAKNGRSVMPDTHESAGNQHGFALAHKTQTIHRDLAHPPRLPGCCSCCGGDENDSGPRASGRPKSAPLGAAAAAGRPLPPDRQRSPLTSRRRSGAAARKESREAEERFTDLPASRWRRWNRLPPASRVATRRGLLRWLLPGKYQFDYGTWESMGGSGDPAAAPEPSRTTARRCSTRPPAPVPGPSAASARAAPVLTMRRDERGVD